MRQLATLDAQFLALESRTTYGHVGGLAIFDPSTAPGGGSRSTTCPGCSKSACTCCRRSAGGSPRSRSASTSRTGSTTPTSTSATTCARSRCRRPATTRQLSTQSRGSSPVRWTARARCGSSTSSRAAGGHTSRLLTKIHHAIGRRHVGRRDPERAPRPVPEGREIPPARRWRSSTGAGRPRRWSAARAAGCARQPLRCAPAPARPLPHVDRDPRRARAAGRDEREPELSRPGCW